MESTKMKLVGIVGSIAEQSYNKLLMRFIAEHYSNIVDIEVLDITDVPMFNQSNDQSNSPTIQYLNRKIMEADGVISQRTEHNQRACSIEGCHRMVVIQPASFTDKAGCCGASITNKIKSCSIKFAPNFWNHQVNAITMPCNDFCGNVKEVFDEEGNL